MTERAAPAPEKKKRKRVQLRGKTRWRLFFAALLCGPLTGLGLILIIGALSLPFNGGATALTAEVLLGGAFIGCAFGWPLMIVYGLPAHAMLYRRRSYKLASYVLSGVLGGFLASAIVGVFAYLNRFGPLNTDQLGIGAMFGVILLIASIAASILFWLIRRPDRDTDTTEALASTFD